MRVPSTPTADVAQAGRAPASAGDRGSNPLERSFTARFSGRARCLCREIGLLRRRRFLRFGSGWSRVRVPPSRLTSGRSSVGRAPCVLCRSGSQADPTTPVSCEGRAFFLVQEAFEPAVRLGVARPRSSLTGLIDHSLACCFLNPFLGLCREPIECRPA